MRAVRSSATALALLSLAAATDCAGDSCGADQDQEAAALLQHAAAAPEKRVQADTTETTTLTCYPNQATTTCGASGACFLDTEGCSENGEGQCCMAAGTSGPKQCRFCNCFGTDYCANFPSPTPAPTPAPTVNCPEPGPMSYGQSCEYANGPNGYWYGCCQSHLVCSSPEYGTCQYPPTPAPTPAPTVNCPEPGPMSYGQSCEYANGPDGYWYGCCQISLVCSSPSYGTCQYPVATIGGR